MWVYGHTRLADYYAGRLSLRELLNRLLSLPHEAPVNRVFEEWAQQATARATVAEVEQTLAMFKPQA